MQIARSITLIYPLPAGYTELSSHVDLVFPRVPPSFLDFRAERDVSSPR